MTSDGERVDRDQDPTSTYRPALVKLTQDLRQSQSELFAGFPSRRELLLWMQRLTVRTLGELPQRYFWELARQFRLDVRDDVRQGVLLAGLLQGSERTRDLPVEVVDELRERLAASMIRPAFDRAFRSLRKDAGEYIDEGDAETAHDPSTQRFVAMRPALDELEEWQETALIECIDGFDEPKEILQWGESVELATHGEINQLDKPEWVPTSSVDEDFITRCFSERSTRAVLCAEDGGRAARELLASMHLIPAYNRGVRDLSGRSGELPDADTVDKSPAQL